MRKALDSTGLRSKKELLAKNSLPGENNMLPPESRLNRLNVELIISLPVSGDADRMYYYYSNPLWLDCLQYSLEDMKQINNNFFSIIINENDHFRVRKLIRDLSYNDNGKVIRNTFAMNCKNKEEFIAYWSCTVAQWHYRGRPKLISFCGSILDENFRDRAQMQAYLNRCAHSERVKIAKALPKDLFDVLRVMHEGGTEKEMADKLDINVECFKKRKTSLVKKLNVADRTDLKDFIFRSSLFA